MTTSFTARGLIVPLLTPMTPDGEEIDTDALAAHVRWLVQMGVHGLMPCGTTGEGPLLTEAERREILETVLEAAGGQAAVIPHVGAVTTRETVALAQHAQAAGAHAVSALTPYYYRVPDEAIVEHYRRVAEAVPDLALFLYNIPGNTGNSISRRVAEVIAERCPNVAGIKDSSGDIDTLAGYVGRKRGQFQVVCGSDALLARALQAGACASVSGNANVVPEVVRSIFDAHWRGDTTGAAHGQVTLDQARVAMGNGGSLALLKAMSERRGARMGGVRPPLPPAPHEAVAEAEARLRQLGLLS
jgi:dihydrodipicolinate synthase/N-acetylneuraminate lyase